MESCTSSVVGPERSTLGVREALCVGELMDAEGLGQSE